MEDTMQLPNNTFDFAFTNLQPYTLYQVGVALIFEGEVTGVTVATNVTTLEDGKWWSRPLD